MDADRKLALSLPKLRKWPAILRASFAHELKKHIEPDAVVLEKAKKETPSTGMMDGLNPEARGHLLVRSCDRKILGFAKLYRDLNPCPAHVILCDEQARRN